MLLENKVAVIYTTTLADAGNVVAFAASDWENSITTTEINISCGALID